MIAVMPAWINSSGASGKGKNASDPAAEPARDSAWPFLRASSIAIFADMGRDICPAPAPNNCPPFAMATALDFTCLVTSQMKAKSAHSASVGRRMEVTVHFSRSKPAKSGC